MKCLKRRSRRYAMKFIAYLKGDDRIVARVLDQNALPVAKLEDFWANP
jgi:hypothetical protein